MKKLIYAFRFMTALPIPWKEGEDLDDVARSISLFPLVGLLIGAVSFLIARLSPFSDLLTAVLVVLWWTASTGALHLDGLADTADGVWGGMSPEKRLEIMKDSRTGVFGAVTLIIFLLLKVALVGELLNSSFLLPLLMAPVVARWISVFAIAFFPTARKEGLGNFFKERCRSREWLWALFWAVLLTLSSGWWTAGGAGVAAALAVFVTATLIAAAAARFFKGKLGGLTGDIYGALCEGTEALVLICFSAAALWSGLW